jgi:serine protease Do
MAREIVYDDPEMNEAPVKVKNGKRWRFVILSIFLVIISLIVGTVGGVGGVIFLSNNTQLADKLGIDTKKLSIPTTSTQKIVVEESSAIIDATNKVAPSVVSIMTTQVYQDIFGRQYEASGAGTGFILTSDGLIVTNRHVVEDQNSTYKVVLADGTTYDAQIKSIDTINDFAVIKVDAKNLPVVELGNSIDLKVGQWVVAVGNALGQFQNTVTVGIISAKDRQVTASDSSGGSSENLDGMLQTDAAINSGNSGGPLVNLAGQVIGINTAVASGAQGIGFAIPIDSVKSAIDSIKETGRIIRPYLGVRYVSVTKDIATQNNLSVDYGALVIRGNSFNQPAVVSGSPADKAGIKEGDVILEVDGTRIDEDHGLVALIQEHNVGDKVDLKVLSGGDEKTITVTLEEAK